MKTLFSIISAIALLLGTLMPVSAASSNGVWLRGKTKAHIQSFSCGGGLGLKIVKSAKKKNVGKVIMCGAKKTGPNKWKGSLTSTEDGKTYTGYVKIKGKTLSLDGCVLGGLVCKNENWSRLR